MAIVLAYIFSIGAGASASCAATENVVFPEYEYDADTNLLEVSLHYRGEEISAIGVSLEYDPEIMDYTSYSRGDGFLEFTLTASLDNSGRVRVLTYSPTDHGTGEIIRLCFKIKDISHADGFVIFPKPLTNNPCAKIENGKIQPVEVDFVSVKLQPLESLPNFNFCGITPSGELLLLTDKEIKDCIFDITVVDMSGKIYRTQSYERCKRIKFKGRDISLFAISTGEIFSPYTVVIIDAYAEYNNKICYLRSVYLFRNGAFLG